MKLRGTILYSTAFFLTIAAPTFAATKGSQVFHSHCVMCHGEDGTGNTPAGKAFKAANFHSPAVVKLSDADLTEIISNGKNRMPAYADRLDATDIQNVIAYIRTLQSSKP